MKIFSHYGEACSDRDYGFRDIFAVYNNPEALSLLNCVLTGYAEVMKSEADVVIGIEARGFLIGPALAASMNCGFVPVRKKGKLPGNIKQKTYCLEYAEVILFTMYLISKRIARDISPKFFLLRIPLKFKKIV